MGNLFLDNIVELLVLDVLDESMVATNKSAKKLKSLSSIFHHRQYFPVYETIKYSMGNLFPYVISIMAILILLTASI